MLAGAGAPKVKGCVSGWEEAKKYKSEVGRWKNFSCDGPTKGNGGLILSKNTVKKLIPYLPNKTRQGNTCVKIHNINSHCYNTVKNFYKHSLLLNFPGIRIASIVLVYVN